MSSSFITEIQKDRGCFIRPGFAECKRRRIRAYTRKIDLVGKAFCTIRYPVFYLAKLFHPDEFKDLMWKKRETILKIFYRVDGLYTELAKEFQLYR